MVRIRPRGKPVRSWRLLEEIAEAAQALVAGRHLPPEQFIELVQRLDLAMERLYEKAGEAPFDWTAPY